MALVSCTLAAITKAPPTSEETATPATAITINPKLRIALLEALSSYDGEDSTEADNDEASTSGVTSDFEDVTNEPFVKIHTFAIDGDKSDENEVIKTIIITRPRTTLTPPKNPSSEISDRRDQVNINFDKSTDPLNAESDRSSNVQLVRSIESPNSVNSNDKKEEKLKKKASEKSVTKPITPQTTTTTTLPPPVTNADGQNIEKVAKSDVKILQAPLLAAFTVQQDVNGQSKKVIQLFKNPQENDVNSKRIINMEFKPSQPVPTIAPTLAPSTTIQVPKESPNQQLLTAFEEKQRQLEDQIRFLQARQREQDEIIRRHQLLQEQHNRQNFAEQQRSRFEDEQRQRQQFDEDQRQRQRFEQEQKFLLRQQQANAIQQPQAQALQAPPSPSANVQFIPSIPIGHTVGISVEQRLPFKGPFEFNTDRPELQKTFSQFQQQFQHRQFQRQQQPFQPLQQQQIFQQQPRNSGFNLQQSNQPLIQQHEVQQITALPTTQELPVRQPQNFVQFSQLPTNLELPQKPFQTFNSQPLAVLPSITELVPQTQPRTRVFRQDASQTGNFGFNDFGNFQIQQQQLNPVDTSLDGQIQNIFHQSGINQRSAEDFRIISKILSSNHGVGNNVFLTNSGRFN